MKTVVIPTRGHMRGQIGWIAGDLADHKARATRAGVWRTPVYFPGIDFPNDCKVLPFAALRAATEWEITLGVGVVE